MKTCKNIECARDFDPPKETSRYCSNPCKHLGSRSSGLERVCKLDGCTQTFRLTSAGNRKVYCSRSCANMEVKRKPTKVCRNCEKALANRSSTYCSQSCHILYKYDKYISDWLSGMESGGTKYGCTEQVRRWVRELYGLFCWECGWCKIHPITGEPPLQIDHIDGDAGNNRPENLRLICGGCHSLTPTYGNLGGRKSARTYRYDKNGN